MPRDGTGMKVHCICRLCYGGRSLDGRLSRRRYIWGKENSTPGIWGVKGICTGSVRALDPCGPESKRGV